MKQLVLLLDGTWDNTDTSDKDTNIARLRGLLDRSLSHTGHSSPQPGHGGLWKPRRFAENGHECVVYYQPGLGSTTDRIQRQMQSAAFGEGIAFKIREGYKFLAQNYVPGDKIYILGFSRGAFAARSLAGYVAAAGLLRPENCTPAMESRAWAYYRQKPADRYPAEKLELATHVWPADEFAIELLAVFDTVGALGIPLVAFSRANAAKYGFHDVELNRITKVNLQALAVDEHREAYCAALWQRTPFLDFSGKVEQVWFAGAHADVGGSMVIEAERKALPQPQLDDIALDWMLKRIRLHLPDFPIDPRLGPHLSGTKDYLAPQHEMRQFAWRLLRTNLRAIANTPVPDSWLHFVEASGYDRHAEVLHESIHQSVIERLGHYVDVSGDALLYSPENLMAVFDQITATYMRLPGLAQPAREIRIVDWAGHPLNPYQAGECAAAATLVLAARERLKLPTLPGAD